MNSLANLKSTWAALEPRRRIALAVSALVIAGFVFLMARIVATPSMALLYSGLESSAASGVVEALDRQNVPYEVRGDAIYVPASRRDKVRILLAGEGLPTAGAAGYELLDGLSGFGATAEMFDAAYVRAKEGELARTTLAFSGVVRARVHIANMRRRPFERRAEPTASVTVSTTGGPLSRTKAEAIRFLVASAVGGLSLNNVAVIDQEYGVILRSGDEDVKTGADDAAARAETLRRSVTRLLEARVGPGAAVVEVSVATTGESEKVRERVIDPNTKVVVHKDTEESTDKAEGESNAVTVASNVAQGDIGGADQSSRQVARTRERVNFEVSEIVRERVRPAGDVSRLTVAVMVDGVRTTAEDGASVWAPRPPEELEALRALVQSAVGYDESRGDVVTIETLEFTDVAETGEVAQAGFAQLLAANAMPLVQLLALGVVAALLGMFVLRPILSASRTRPEPPALASPDVIEGAPATTIGVDAYAGGPPAGANGGPVAAGALAAPAAVSAAAASGQGDSVGQPGPGATGAVMIPSAGGASGPGESRREKLNTAISGDTDKAARLLRAWLDEPETEVAI